MQPCCTQYFLTPIGSISPKVAPKIFQAPQAPEANICCGINFLLQRLLPSSREIDLMRPLPRDKVMMIVTCCGLSSELYHSVSPLCSLQSSDNLQYYELSDSQPPASSGASSV